MLRRVGALGSVCGSVCGSMPHLARGSVLWAIHRSAPQSVRRSERRSERRSALPGLLLALAAPLSMAQDAPADLGKQVFDDWCGICHGLPNGASGGGTETLAALYQGTDIPAQLEDRSDLTAELVVTLTREGRNTMPNFRKTEISDAELEALVAYLLEDNAE